MIISDIHKYAIEKPSDKLTQLRTPLYFHHTTVKITWYPLYLN